MTATHPARRPDIEAWLDELGAKWRFDGDLRLDRIDQAASLANQARHEALTAEVVELYTSAMEDGAQFPPIIVHDVDDPLDILGGNHRYAAHLNNGHTTAPAYLVKANGKIITRIRFEDNAKHGLPLKKAERVAYAVAFMNAGMSQTEAGAIVGLTQSMLSAATIAVRALQRAHGMGIEGFDRLPESIRTGLGGIGDDDVFAALSDLTIRARLTRIEVRALIPSLNAVDPHEALRIIGGEAEDMAERIANPKATGGTAKTARARLDAALAIIRGLKPADVVASCPNADVAAVLAQRILDTAKVLANTRDRLTTPKSLAS